METKKCHNCKGKGIVNGKTVGGKCLYCKGKGYRTNNYGIDKE